MRNKHIKFSVFLFLAACAGIIAIAAINKRYQTVVVDIPKFEHQIPAPPTAKDDTATKNNTTAPKSEIITPKSSLLLPVPFTPQAPTGNWDTIHNEDCEEASAIMANAFFNGPKGAKLDTSYVETELTKLTNWEMQNFGYNLDVTSEETVKMIQANYGLSTKILYSFTEEDIKKELAQNHLVLFPANGQMLGNPNYKQPGPKYHMLVIRGYTSTSIITNDPGTRNGLNYAYSFTTLYKANGNWSHASNSVDLGNKNVIVVWNAKVP